MRPYGWETMDAGRTRFGHDRRLPELCDLSINVGSSGTCNVPPNARELSMKEVVKPGDWSKPHVKRLGKIKDVAGPQTPGPQGAGAKS